MAWSFEASGGKPARIPLTNLRHVPHPKQYRAPASTEFHAAYGKAISPAIHTVPASRHWIFNNKAYKLLFIGTLAMGRSIRCLSRCGSLRLANNMAPPLFVPGSKGYAVTVHGMTMPLRPRIHRFGCCDDYGRFRGNSPGIRAMSFTDSLQAITAAKA